MNHNEKILLVDDELRVVQALQRALRSEFHIEIAGGSEAGLQVLARDGPFAVVVSDLRMPVMDGVQFLSRVKAVSPDSIRVMLTGQADMHAAIAAVNEGNIFRFLTKPCPPAILSKVLEASLEQCIRQRNYRVDRSGGLAYRRAAAHAVGVSPASR
jgi:DNA-binding NtrC family response regulator